MSLVSQLYSRRCEIWAGEVARQILGSENLDASTSQEMMIFFSQLKPRQDVVNAVETVDRIFWIDGIVYHTDDFIDAQKLLPHSDFYFIDNLYKYLTIDWNGVLIQFNRDIDQLVELCKIEEYNARNQSLNDFIRKLKERKQATLAVQLDIFFRGGRARRIISWLTDSFCRAIPEMLWAENRSNTRQRLLHTAAALAVYRLGSGAYPDALQPLINGSLSEIPTDDFHQLPLIFQKTPTGYLLYSVGPNGVDDQGNNAREGIVQGYSIFLDQTQIRMILGLSGEDDHQLKVGEDVPISSDDLSIRLPLIQSESPTFLWADWQKNKK